MDEERFRKAVENCIHNLAGAGGNTILRIYQLERQVRLLQLSIAAIAAALLIRLIK